MTLFSKYPVTQRHYLFAFGVASLFDEVGHDRHDVLVVPLQVLQEK